MIAEMIIRSVLLGAGLAMDAFSVSMADGLGEPDMSGRRMLGIAGTFAAFQCAMPLIGWVLVRTAVRVFGQLETFIPWIALILLLYIGGRMLLEGLRDRREGAADRADGAERDRVDGTATVKTLGSGELIVQGIATSIDALSVGFAIEQYSGMEAIASSLIIGIVTLVICLGGLAIGRRAGTRLAGRSVILGGIILIIIGIEIWLRGIL